MHISSVCSTYCFVAQGDRLAQVVRVTVADAPPGAPAEVSCRAAMGSSGPSPGTGTSTRPWRAGRAVPPGHPVLMPGWPPSRPALPPPPSCPTAWWWRSPCVFDRRPARRQCRHAAGVVAVGRWPRAESEAEVVVREPGWRMLMVPHFHYDPVWWNTQAGYTSGWDELFWAQDMRETFQHSGLGAGRGPPGTGAPSTPYTRLSSPRWTI